MKDLSIKLKLVLGVVLGVGLAAIATLAAVNAVVEDNVRMLSRQSVRTAAESFALLERKDVAKLSATLEPLLADPGLREQLAKRDKEGLLALAAPVFKELRDRHGITHWYFMAPEPERTCLLRVHKPEISGDAVPRATLTQAVESKRMGAGLELGKTAFALRVVRPAHDASGNLLGYVELGEEIDHFLAALKVQTGDEFGLVLSKKHLDEKEWAQTRAVSGARNDWADRASVVLADSTLKDAHLVDYDGDLEAVPDEGLFLEELQQGGSVFVRGLFPVRDAAGGKVGAVFVLHDITAFHDGMTRTAGRLMAAIAVLAMLAIVALLWFLQRLVFRRLRAMMVRMEDLSLRVAGGDYDVGASLPPVEGKDEIGAFEEFLGRFLTLIGGTLKELERKRAS